MSPAAKQAWMQQLHRLPPGPALPPWIQLGWWLLAPVPFMRRSARHHGDTFTVRFPGGRSFVFTSDPATIKRAFTATPDEYTVREGNILLRPLLGDHSLLLLDGSPHLHERRMMMPPFHGERMQVYGDIIRAATDRVIDGWRPGQRFSIHGSMQTITLDVIIRAVFGVEREHAFGPLRDLLGELLGTIANPLSIVFGASGTTRIPWFLRLFERWFPVLQFERVKQKADAMLYQEIANRRRDPDKSRNDILHMLIEARDENGVGLTDEQLRDEMMTLLVAGHETTATTLCWIFGHILSHPPVLARLLDELANAGDDVQRLPYLDAVIKESMRITPILPFVGRKLKEAWQVGDVEVPAGAVLSPCVYLTHHRADLWPRPEAFDPERFLDGRLNPYAWFPFGGGVRRCLGMAFAMFEMKVVVAQVLRRVRLSLPPGYQMRVVRRSITLSPSGGLPVLVR